MKIKIAFLFILPFLLMSFADTPIKKPKWVKLFNGKDLKGWTSGAIINRDKGLKLQYLAGLGLNLYHANDFYQNMVSYGPRMPENMFVGSPTTLDLLARMIESGQFR